MQFHIAYIHGAVATVLLFMFVQKYTSWSQVPELSTTVCMPATASLIDSII
jgi:hypothetical protein